MKLVPKLHEAIKANKKSWLVYDTLYIESKPFKSSQERSESGISVLVWNCNGLTDRKLTDSEFISFLSNNDIIILSESWTDNDSSIDIENFTTYNFFRKFKHRKARRNSGGITIYVRNTCNEGVSIVKNHFDTLIWLRLKVV